MDFAVFYEIQVPNPIKNRHAEFETFHEVLAQVELAEEMGFSLRQVKLYREAGKAPISLDAPLSEGEDGKQVSEVVADPNVVAAYDQMIALAHRVFPYVEGHKFYCEHLSNAMAVTGSSYVDARRTSTACC